MSALHFMQVVVRHGWDAGWSCKDLFSVWDIFLILRSWWK
jgi:hypothetical protein